MKGAVSKDSTATQKDHRLVVFVLLEEGEKNKRGKSNLSKSWVST